MNTLTHKVAACLTATGFNVHHVMPPVIDGFDGTVDIDVPGLKPGHVHVQVSARHVRVQWFNVERTVLNQAKATTRFDLCQRQLHRAIRLVVSEAAVAAGLFDHRLYMKGSISGVTLRPNKSVKISAGVPRDLLATIYKYVTGDFVEDNVTPDTLAKSLRRFGYTTITADARGWTEPTK
jgi:hypothetical protein